MRNNPQTDPAPKHTRCKESFVADENGSMTLMGLFFFISAATLGALALDVTSLFSARTHLQTAADTAAHAALYNRGVMDADTAKSEALALVETTLPKNEVGVALTVEDIDFGYFASGTGNFVVDDTSRTAVRVVTSFTEERSNAATAYLFRLIGFDDFDIVTSAAYSTFRPGCLNEGFVAEGVVDIQSNNAFGNGFCIHSNTYVSLNSNNIFEAGTVVSMPDLETLDLPKSGLETNLGLAAALRSGSMNIRVLSRIDNMVYSYTTGDTNPANFPNPFFAPATDALPDYITNLTLVEMKEMKIETADLEEGRVHYIDCKGPSGLTIDATTTLRNMVIVSPCEIKFSAGSVIEDARIISTSTSSDAISSPSGLRVGRDDNCSVGGGVQLVTNGGMSFPANLQIYGSQLMAKGDITFAANANGVQGASLIAGGEISGTSNMNMGLCGTGMEDNIAIDYYRMVM